VSALLDGSEPTGFHITIAENITDRKRAAEDKANLERQLLQAQKMEAVGQLAGGIAHDFNNLLLVISGYTSMVQERQAPESEDNLDLDEVRKAADRATVLTRQLLSFSRRQTIQPLHVDLNDLIEDALRMIRRVIGEHIDFRFLPSPRLETIYVDKGQIEQVLMNLCVNARDAMNSGGTLTIQTMNAVLDESYCANHPWAKEGHYVVLDVTDTGHGMDPTTCARIFEPFFTTKELGQGTGLGLSTVYGIVRQNDGLIQVNSEPGKGTSFKIYIPSVELPAEPKGTALESRVTGGSETLLIAEDEESVRHLLQRILEIEGYTVLTATDGEDALRVFDAHAHEIDLAVLDVMMPKLGGRQVMDRIQAKCPRMRFLFASGYSKNALHKDFVIEEGIRLVPKPYQRAVLLRAIREVLDAPQP
jgi:signal transduction histidine kinase/CheY-like chemotaxis protein